MDVSSHVAGVQCSRPTVAVLKRRSPQRRGSQAAIRKMSTVASSDPVSASTQSVIRWQMGLQAVAQFGGQCDDIQAGITQLWLHWPPQAM